MTTEDVPFREPPEIGDRPSPVGSTNRPWTPECVVSAPLARELIEAQIPVLSPVKIAPLGSGWDNTVYRVNDQYVFRFPRRQVAVELLDVELRLLPAIADRLPLPIPVPIMFGQPCDRYEWPFAGYRFLPGRTACRASMDSAQRAEAAAPIAQFLAALHAIPADEATDLGVPFDTLGRLDPLKRAASTQTNLDQLVRSGLIDDYAPWLQVADQLASIRPARGDTLVHGDLYALHILVDANATPCGCIDWGDAHVGDPAVDLAMAQMFLPPEAQSMFRSAYGGIDEETWRLAGLRAWYDAALTTAYGHEIGDDHLVREGLTALGYLSAVPFAKRRGAG